MFEYMTAENWKWIAFTEFAVIVLLLTYLRQEKKDGP